MIESQKLYRKTEMQKISHKNEHNKNHHGIDTIMEENEEEDTGSGVPTLQNSVIQTPMFN